MTPSVLILDDEQNILRSLEMILKAERFSVATAASIAQAKGVLATQSFQFFIIDVILPDGDGIEFIEQVRASHPASIIIMMSGHASIKMAIDATRKGADDFLEKPLSKDKLLLTLRNFIKRLEIEQRYSDLQKTTNPDAFIGQTPTVEEILKTVDKIAPTNSKVLITGESGTGKEIVAQMIHQKSQRHGQPYVKINCAAIPEELIEAELFGVEKGAYTGAGERRDGKFKQADGGTLFLDEIGDMSLKTQTKVLRVLQDGEFERVGGSESISTDVRIIAATNKDLQQAVAAKQFREDLYFRLHVVPIHLPPLRDRRDDIPLLVDYFMTRFSQENNKPRLHIAPAAKQQLQHYTWPGNIRELKNTIERLVIMADSDTIDASHLPANLLTIPIDTSGAFRQRQTLFEFRDDAEAAYIRFCLDQFNGNISQTAKALGVDRSYLHRRIKKFGGEP
ncbi:sigma-54-dependent Fis family transcriptional regulator [candidate division KSB1 bacterium]|nr:sigma-54-dependent Fis family transcriptional regulator [candidate division KSB1 bacterium]